jgi:hypothetical protein
VIPEETAPYLDKESLERGLANRPDSMTEAEALPLMSELGAFYRSMQTGQRGQPAVFQPAGEWSVYIEARREFYLALSAGDGVETWRSLKDFWRNRLGAIVKQYALFESLAAGAEARRRFVELMARDYVIWRHLFGEDPATLAIPPVGNPWGCHFDNVLIAPKALRYHALSTQIRHITSDVPRPVIAEIGAGYGGMAYYLLRGDQPVCYLDFDLPETLVLAAYYLRRTLPHRKVHLCARPEELTPALLQACDVVLAPNWGIRSLPGRSVDLFLNTFSLSEMPMPAIAEYLQQIERTCRGYFLHNNMDRPGVINGGSERIPCSRYPIPAGKFKLLSRRYDLFQDRHHGRDGDYRELLYQRIH